MDWLANNESSLSAIAAIIAIIAGLAVVFRLVWVRMVARNRPTFLSDWRNIGLIALAGVALVLLLILSLSTGEPDTKKDLASVNSGKPSVAVLPLNNISGDPEQQYLADGITEDVITLLSRNPRFFVIARNSSFIYKGKAVDIRQVGKELGVRYVVEGSLRKIGERLRITVQLIETASGQHVWAEQYDRPFVELFDLQDDITNGIALALGDEIYRAEIARANARSTSNLDAWGLVMRASQSYVGYNRASVAEAIPLFRAALTQDPGYILAKAELAKSLCYRYLNQFSDSPAQDLAEAHKLSEQILLAAPDDPLILTAIGTCYGTTGRRREGIRLLEKAVAKRPRFAEAWSTLGGVLALDEQPAIGLPLLEKALLLSPKSPQIYLHQVQLSIALNELGRYKEAEQATKNSIRSYEGYYFTWVQLAYALAGQGSVNEAKQALYDARRVEARFSLNFMKKFAAITYKNKGKNLFAVLEPIWPEDLLTAEENGSK